MNVITPIQIQIQIQTELNMHSGRKQKTLIVEKLPIPQQTPKTTCSLYFHEISPHHTLNALLGIAINHVPRQPIGWIVVCRDARQFRHGYSAVKTTNAKSQFVLAFL